MSDAKNTYIDVRFTSRNVGKVTQKERERSDSEGQIEMKKVCIFSSC